MPGMGTAQDSMISCLVYDLPEPCTPKSRMVLGAARSRPTTRWLSPGAVPILAYCRAERTGAALPVRMWTCPEAMLRVAGCSPAARRVACSGMVGPTAVGGGAAGHG